jgi:hypothetical protein
VAREVERARNEPKPPFYNFFGAFLAPYFEHPSAGSTGVGLLCKSIGMQCYVNEAIVACAIERYRLANGKLPASLDDLRMENMPHDVIGGGPLQYRATGDDYIVYSLGWQGKYNGGKVERTEGGGVDWTKSDWVWTLKPLE